MYQLSCGEIWGGIRNCDVDFTSAGLTVSLYSVASDGAKGGDTYFLSFCDGNPLTRIILADVLGHGEDVSQISQIIYNAIQLHMTDSDGNRLPAELKHVVIDEIRRFTGGSLEHDDVTVMVVTIN